MAAAAESMAAPGTNSTIEAANIPDAVEDLRHMTSFIVPFTIVAFIITLAQRFLKGAMPSMVLNGLTFVTLKQQSAPLPQPASSKKQEKKMQQQLKTAQSSSASMAWSTVSSGLLDRLEMTEDFDLLLLGCLVFAVNAVFAVAAKWLLYPIVAPFYLSLTLTGFAFVGSLMAKVEWIHTAIVKSEKLYMLIVGILAASFSFWLLMYAPRSLHVFDAEAASVEMVGRVQTLLTTRLTGITAKLQIEVPEAPEAPAMAVALPLALFAGALSALLMAPGLRYGRVLQVLLKPPMWARNFAGQPSFMRLLVQAGFIAQVMMLPLWVPPLTDALLIPADVVSYLRGSSMLLVVGLQLLALRQLVQAHLFIAPYKADIIHSMLGLDAEMRAGLLKRQLSRTIAELCKVALQLAFLPSLLLLCGSLYMLMAFPSPMAATHPKATHWDKQPSVLYQTVSGFLGWWACASYVGWATIGVVLARALGAGD